MLNFYLIKIMSLFFKIIKHFHQALKPVHSNKYDIGLCKSVEICCISELGWKDNKNLIGNVQKFGNLNTSQYKIEWNKENSAGSSSLITIETLANKTHKFLVDSGWDKEYMDECFKREKIDKLLSNNEIDFLYFTHEHMDHFFGIESVLKWNNHIPIVVPHTFSEEGYKVIQGEMKSINKIKHEGPIYKTQEKIPHQLYEGCATYCFEVKTLLGVVGEQTLYFNVKNKGLVGVTGCCHGGVIDFLEFGKNSIENEKLHAIYGGLHISPFEGLDPQQQEEVIRKLGDYKLEKLACNHCTGISAVNKMISLGYPVVQGSAKFGTKSDKFLGNGDKIKF